MHGIVLKRMHFFVLYELVSIAIGLEAIAISNKRTLLGAPGLTTRSDRTPLGAPGIATSSILTSNKKVSRLEQSRLYVLCTPARLKARERGADTALCAGRARAVQPLGTDPLP